MERSGRNSLYGVLGFALPTLVMIVAFPILLSRLGTEIMGIYILSTTFSGIWVVLDFSVAAGTLKFVAEDVAKGDAKSAAEVIAISLLFYVLIGALIAGGVWFLSPRLTGIFSISLEMETDAVIAFRLAAVRFALFFLTTVFISVFKAFHRFEWAAVILTALSLITFGGATFGVVFMNAGLVGISWIGLAANVVIFAVSAGGAIVLCRRRKIFLAAARISFGTLRRIFGYSFFIALNGLSVGLVTQLQRMLVSVFLGPAAVAVFVIAATVMTKCQQALYAMFEFITPSIASMAHRLDAKRSDELARSHRRWQLLSLGLSICGAAVLYFAAPWLITFWLSSDIDAEVIELVRIFSVAIAAYGLVPLAYHTINGFGRPGRNTIFLWMGPLVLYAALVLLSLDGLDLRDFTIAQSLSVVVYSVALFVFYVLVVQRRWFRAGGVAAATG